MGLVLLPVVVIYLAIVTWITWGVSQLFENKYTRFGIFVGSLALFACTPVADEIVGH